MHIRQFIQTQTRIHTPMNNWGILRRFWWAHRCKIRRGWQKRGGWGIAPPIRAADWPTAGRRSTMRRRRSIWPHLSKPFLRSASSSCAKKRRERKERWSFWCYRKGSSFIISGKNGEIAVVGYESCFLGFIGDCRSLSIKDNHRADQPNANIAVVVVHLYFCVTWYPITLLPLMGWWDFF